MWGNTNWINSEYRHFSRSVFELINYILKTINLIKSDLTRQDQIWSPLSKRHKIHKYNFDCFHGNGILSACPGVSQFCRWPGQSDTKKKIRNLQKKKKEAKSSMKITKIEQKSEFVIKQCASYHEIEHTFITKLTYVNHY